jgi:hypothetical protein
MISSQEFQQKLQAGHIHEALAIVVRDTSQLDIVTQMTEASLASSQSASSEYLRTTINLLTGEIYNEVGKDLVVNSDTYRQLQQLHTDRIVASHRLVQGYLHQIETILRVVSPPQSESRSSIADNRIDATSLVTLLNRSSSQSIANQPSSQQAEINTSDNSTFAEHASDRLGDRERSWELQPSPPALEDRHLWIDNTDPLAFDEPLPMAVDTIESHLDVLPMDDEIDLSIDEDSEVWEEWLEDDDFLSAVLPQPPSVLSASSVSNLPDRLIGRHLHPIGVKPISPRTTVESVDPLARWDKFEPEYIGISTDELQQPQPSIDRDTERMARLFADLDI